MIVEEFPEKEWGYRAAINARNARAGQLRDEGYVVDVETIRSISIQGSGHYQKVARLLAYTKHEVRTVTPNGTTGGVAAENIRAALFKIGETLVTADKLTSPYAEFDEDTGEPLDSDAELSKLAQEAEAMLDLVERAALAGVAALAVLKDANVEKYKEHLYFDAARGFKYDGVDDSETGNNLEGRFEGAFEAALKLGAVLDKAAIMARGEEQLLAEIRREIPLLRERAAKSSPSYSSRQSSEEDLQTGHDLREARNGLEELESALDSLLDNARKKGETGAPSGTPPAWEVLFVPSGKGADDTRVLDTLLTREAALSRKASIEAGAYNGIGYGYPPPGSLRGAEIILVEKE